MAQTIFYIPPTLFGLPLFGFGLMFWCATVLGGGLALWQFMKGWTSEGTNTAILAGFLAAAAVWLLPSMVEADAEGVLYGVPIRGFGLMVMLAVVSGVGISAWRARRVGLDPELIFSLAFWMVLGGFLGGRLFYVIQYRGEYFKEGLTWVQSLQAMASIAQGGLVVYGALIGALAAAAWFLHRRKLPLLPIADIIAPGMALGQALGRVGCFLNGCCYGGLCTLPLVATPFPLHSAPTQRGPSPPYEKQLSLGWIHGFELTAQQKDGTEQLVVSRVLPGGPAEQAGLKTGDVITKINGLNLTLLRDAHDQLQRSGEKVEELPDSLLNIARKQLAQLGPAISLQTDDERRIEWSLGTLPAWSLPIHPTQLYAFVDAGLLALLLWSYYPFRRRDGEVFALLLTLHPISRFLLETIRMDEPGQFGTAFTISQWISIALFAAACGLWVYIERQPAGTQQDFAPQPMHG